MPTVTRAHRERSLALVRQWWVAPLLCAVVSAGMFVSTPTYGSPDAVVNLSTGWYDVHHGIPTASRINEPEFGYSGKSICYAFYSEQNALCRTDGRVTDIFSSRQRIANYPPFFFWIVGLGELSGGAISRSVAPDGGRLFALIACLALIFLAAWRLHRAQERSAIWGAYLLAVPMATFLFPSANANGWEIACALFFAATLLWRRAELLDGSTGYRPVWSIMIAGILLATARPSGAVWLLTIAIVFVFWIRAWALRRAISLVAIAIAPGVAISLVWSAMFPFIVRIGQPTLSLSPGALPSQLAASVQDVFAKTGEVWGVLGWLDTYPSALVLVALVGVLIYFFPTYAPTREHRRLLVAAIALVFSASVVLEALSWKAWPSWWQGRYSLPLLAGLALLLFSDPGHRERPRLFALAAWASAFNTYMVCLNYWRYDYGIKNGFPIQIPNAAYGHIHTAGLYLIVLVLMVATAVLFAADRGHREEWERASLKLPRAEAAAP